MVMYQVVSVVEFGLCVLGSNSETNGGDSLGEIGLQNRSNMFLIFLATISYCHCSTVSTKAKLEYKWQTPHGHSVWGETVW